MGARWRRRTPLPPSRRSVASVPTRDRDAARHASSKFPPMPLSLAQATESFNALRLIWGGIVCHLVIRWRRGSFAPASPAKGRVKVAGKAALPPDVRKASGFPAQTASLLPLGSAGRLSLPAEPRVSQGGGLRKGEAFPHVRRQSRFGTLPLGDFDATPVEARRYVWKTAHRCDNLCSVGLPGRGSGDEALSPRNHGTVAGLE
jgi:hypothetical protein